MKKYKNKIWEKKLQMSLEFEKYISWSYLSILEEVTRSLGNEESYQYIWIDRTQTS